MEQKPITIVTEVLDENSLAELKRYLTPIGKDIKNNKIIQFATLKNLHYCCFILIEDNPPPSGVGQAAPILVFEANIDGKVNEFLAEIVRQYPDFMHKVYRNCQDYLKAGKKPSDEELTAYLLANDRGANAFYVGHPGQTHDIISYQSTLRSAIETYLDANRPKLVKLTPDAIKHEILEHVAKTVPGFAQSKPVKASVLIKLGQMLSPYVNWVILFLALAVLVFVYMIAGETGVFFVLGLIAAFIAYLLFREMMDKQDERLQWDSIYLKDLQDVENRQAQNHLSSIIYVKPGKFRLFTLTAVLFFINLVAKLFATEGNLSGIVTIHFARWIILPGKANERTRLLFFSNYDGSWENYLGEFIDHASVGLTAVWSNTESNAKPGGFPDTRLLGVVFDEKKKWTSIFPAGARDEQRFKAFARNSQRPELIWYSAYPDLSVKNIGNNMKIHEGLFSDDELSGWLKRL